MAENRENNLSSEATAEIPGADELFAGQIHEEMSEEQVFVGNEDFYASLTEARDSTEPPATSSASAERSPAYGMRMLRAATIVAIVLIGAILLHRFLRDFGGGFMGSDSDSPAQVESGVNDNLKAQSPDTEPAGPLGASSGKPESALPASYPVSLKVAQDFYQAGQYDKAHDAYKLLTRNLSDNVPHQRDVIRLRMAMCVERAGDLERASQLFDILSRSHSPIVNMMANYQLGSLQMQKGHFLAARRSLYRALALVNVVDLDTKISLLLQQDGHFMASEALTRYVLTLTNKDVGLPDGIWKNPQQIDPLGNLDGEQLNHLALSGIDLLKTGALAPRVKRIDQGDGSARWSVICNGASVEELLSRFAAQAGLDVLWDSKNDADEQSTESIVRRRPLNLYLSAANIGQVSTAAAGSVGMVAKLQDKTITVVYPEEYASLSQHLQLIADEAISMWQRFLLSFHGDDRTVNVHLVLGLLQYVQGKTAESLAEYKLVANRFPNSPLAAHALLNASKVKTELRDYLGARNYLRQLVEQYPDSEIAEQSYMCLADNTLKAGMKDEAAKSYIRVYNLSLSSNTQATAALGAGKCYYETQNYDSAIKWLTKYITITRSAEPDDLWLVYYILGKSYLALGNPVQAYRAFEYALGGQLSREQYVETISVLVDACIERGQFVRALGILEDIQVKQFSQVDSVKVTLLKSRVLRAMGLFDKAIATLGDKAEYTLDPQLAARISFEIAKCHVDQGNWAQAEKKLSEVLVAVESGPPAWDASITMAEVCLQLGRETHTISICRQLLDSDPAEAVRRRTLRLLVEAYSRQKDYDRAALALIGKWK